MKKWSISAHNCFHRCQRQYFFRYIMAHHNAKDVTRREAYLVSQLSSLDAWKGKLVHLALEKYFVSSLQQGNLISCEDLIQKTLVLGRQQLEFARQRKYRETGITKTRAGDKYLALKIHEAEDNFWTDKIDKVFDEVRQCYQNLYNYHKLIDFLTNKVDWCETEFRLSFKLNGVNIVGQPDLLVGYGDRKICVVDWKTGKSQNSDYSTQLYLYGLAVVNSRRWSNYEVSNLLLVEAYLLQNKFIKHSIEISQKQEIEALVSDSILNIEAVTDDHKYDLSKLKNYSYASNPISCEYCNFRSICQNLT